MTHAPHTIDVTEGNFGEHVIAASHQTPVLVDFWASWCGPCRTLLPVLLKLASGYGGRFLLAKVNIDEQPALAQQYGVRSVPTVLMFRGGKAVDQFMGALPESSVREFIERHLPRASDEAAQEAILLHETGRTAEALALLRKAVAEDPAHVPPRLALAEVLVDARDTAAATEELDRLPAAAQADSAARALRSRIRFMQQAPDDAEAARLQARLAAGPADAGAHYRLAHWHAGRNDYEKALEGFLEVLRLERRHDDDGARKAMLDIFNVLGDEGEVVARYRAALTRLLY